MSKLFLKNCFFQAELLVLTSSLHPSEEGEEEKEETSLEEEVVIEEEEDEEEEGRVTRRESQPYLPPPEVVTARAERVVWQRSLPRDFEFSSGLEEDELVELEDEDIEVVEVDGDEEEEEEEEEETSGELGSWDHDLQEQYIRYAEICKIKGNQ